MKTITKAFLLAPLEWTRSGSASVPPMLCSLPNPPPMIAQTL